MDFHSHIERMPLLVHKSRPPIAKEVCFFAVALATTPARWRAFAVRD